MRNLQPLRKGREVISLEEALKSPAHQNTGVMVVAMTHAPRLTEIDALTEGRKQLLTLADNVSSMEYYKTLLVGIGGTVYDFENKKKLSISNEYTVTSDQIQDMCKFEERLLFLARRPESAVLYELDTTAATAKHLSSYHKDNVTAICEHNGNIINGDDRGNIHKIDRVMHEEHMTTCHGNITGLRSNQGTLYVAFTQGHDTEKKHYIASVHGGNVQKLTERPSRINGLLVHEDQLYDYGYYGLARTMSDDYRITDAEITAACVVPKEYVERVQKSR